MEDEYSDSARGLQQRMLEQLRKAYGEAAFERWLEGYLKKRGRRCATPGRKKAQEKGQRGGALK